MVPPLVQFISELTGFHLISHLFIEAEYISYNKITMHTVRVRTESMVQRYAKLPISEGYELWDKDYLLAALRFFTFKSDADGAPPFQIAPCLDATGEISLSLQGQDDARIQFGLAADKYQLIQQPVLAELMRIKITEATEGGAKALEQLQAYLKKMDPEHNGCGNKTDRKLKMGLARCYCYLSELLLSTTEEEEPSAVAPEAVKAASLAVELGWDRVHCGHRALGDALDALGEFKKAKEAYSKAISLCPYYSEAHERLVDVCKSLKESPSAIIALLDKAIEVHPRASLVREKAFVISDMDGDAAALKYLDEQISNPPLEEMELGGQTGGPSLCTLLKAKAAILADGGAMKEALEAAEAAVAAFPSDEEAPRIVNDIKGM